ncbi:MAG: TrkH family potassium uptake protein [Planctomycetes bacterium]|nr:TrkH family potassium uptake protein [Planctomycetota bacterium]
MRLAIVFGIIGQLLRPFALVLLIPLVVGWVNDGFAVASHYAIAALASAGTGWLLALGYRAPKVFRRSEALAVVAGTWLMFGVMAAIPYVLAGLSPEDALFESISGFTTTGATILTDFSRYGRAFFLWRAMTQWIGGMGVIALFVVILPRLGIAGRQIFFAEASGAVSDEISPQVRTTALRLWILYVALTSLQTLLLIIAGYPAYDAVVHSMTTMAAGGFSPNGQSVHGYQFEAGVNAPFAEWIFVVFMISAGASFPLQWRALTHSPRVLWRDGEFMLYLGVTLGGALAVAALQAGGLPGWADVRAGAFQSASLISSTGFASEDYQLWKDSSKAVLVAVMLVGGCAGSAAGGAKVIRHLIVLKFCKREITQVIHPRAVIAIRYRGRVVPREALRAVFTLVMLYLVFYVVFGILAVVLGADLITGFSASLACLGNIGPGFDAVGPMSNFAHFPVATKLILTVAMWIGRLEILTVLALLHPHVWQGLRWRGDVPAT